MLTSRMRSGRDSSGNDFNLLLAALPGTPAPDADGVSPFSGFPPWPPVEKKMSYFKEVKKPFIDVMAYKFWNNISTFSKMAQSQRSTIDTSEEDKNKFKKRILHNVNWE